MGGTGLEQDDITSCENNDLRDSLLDSAAESGAVGATAGVDDSRLQEVSDAWHSLPDAVKTDILLIVRGSSLSQHGRRRVAGPRHHGS